MMQQAEAWTDLQPGGGFSESSDDEMFAEIESAPTADPVEEGIAYINHSLAAFGVSTPLHFYSKRTEDVADLVNFVSRVVRERRQDMDTIDEISNQLHILQAGNRSLKQDKEKLKHTVAAKDKEIASVENQINRIRRESAAAAKKLQRTLSDTSAQCARLRSRDNTYKAALRKKEQEYERLRERLRTAATSSSSGSGGSSASRGQRRSSLSGGRRGVAAKGGSGGSGGGGGSGRRGVALSSVLNESAVRTRLTGSGEGGEGGDGGDSVTQLIVAGYEERQQRVLTENARLRADLADLHSQLSSFAATASHHCRWVQARMRNGDATDADDGEADAAAVVDGEEWAEESGQGEGDCEGSGDSGAASAAAAGLRQGLPFAMAREGLRQQLTAQITTLRQRMREQQRSHFRWVQPQTQAEPQTEQPQPLQQQPSQQQPSLCSVCANAVSPAAPAAAAAATAAEVSAAVATAVAKSDSALQAKEAELDAGRARMRWLQGELREAKGMMSHMDALMQSYLFTDTAAAAAAPAPLALVPASDAAAPRGSPVPSVSASLPPRLAPPGTPAAVAALLRSVGQGATPEGSVEGAGMGEGEGKGEAQCELAASAAAGGRVLFPVAAASASAGEGEAAAQLDETAEDGNGEGQGEGEEGVSAMGLSEVSIGLDHLSFDTSRLPLASPPSQPRSGSGSGSGRGGGTGIGAAAVAAAASSPATPGAVLLPFGSNLSPVAIFTPSPVTSSSSLLGVGAANGGRGSMGRGSMGRGSSCRGRGRGRGVRSLSELLHSSARQPQQRQQQHQAVGKEGEADAADAQGCSSGGSNGGDLNMSLPASPTTARLLGDIGVHVPVKAANADAGASAGADAATVTAMAEESHLPKAPVAATEASTGGNLLLTAVVAVGAKTASGASGSSGGVAEAEAARLMAEAEAAALRHRPRQPQPQQQSRPQQSIGSTVAAPSDGHQLSTAATTAMAGEEDASASAPAAAAASTAAASGSGGSQRLTFRERMRQERQARKAAQLKHRQQEQPCSPAAVAASGPAVAWTVSMAPTPEQATQRRRRKLGGEDEEGGGVATPPIGAASMDAAAASPMPAAATAGAAAASAWVISPPPAESPVVSQGLNSDRWG